MQFDNIRVSRKLWGAFLGLMIAMLLLSAFAQNRGNSSMSAAMDAVVEIEARISAAVRWRGATETAVTMVMGGAVTTDSVLAEQYGAKVKEIIGNINEVQEGIVAAATAPEEKASLDKVLEARKAVLAATAKTWDLKGAGDAVATQRYADEEFAPLVTKYLKAQDDFVTTLEKRRDVIRAEATQRRIEYAVSGIINFSQVPLTIASWFGTTMTGFSFLVLVAIIVRKLIFDDPVPGWASTICIIIFIGGLQLFCLGIIGQYIAKTYMEVKQRPHYIIAESNKKDFTPIR